MTSSPPRDVPPKEHLSRPFLVPLEKGRDDVPGNDDGRFLRFPMENPKEVKSMGEERDFPEGVVFWKRGRRRGVMVAGYFSVGIGEGVLLLLFVRKVRRRAGSCCCCCCWCCRYSERVSGRGAF